MCSRGPVHIPGDCPPVGLVEPAKGEVQLVPDRRLRDRVDELRAWARSRISWCKAYPKARSASVNTSQERRTLEAVLRILDGGDGDGD